MLNKFILILLFIYWPFSQLLAQKQQYSVAQTKILKAADETLKLGIAQKDSLKIAEAYYDYGKITSATHQFLEAEKWFIKSLSILEKKGDSFELGRLYIRLYEIEMLQQHFEKALKYVRIALKIFKNINSDRGLALAYGGFGHIYSHENAPKTILNDDSAFHYFSKIEPHYQKLNDQLGIAGVNLNFGVLYAKKNDKKAIVYYEKALKIFSENNQPAIEVQILLSMAWTFLKFNQNENAYQKILEAEKLNLKVDNYASKRSLARTYLQYYKATGHWKKALKQQEIVHQLEKEDLLADHKGAVSELNIAYDTKNKETQLLLKDNIIVKQNQFLLGVLVLLMIVIGISFLYYSLYKKNKKISHKNEILLKEQNHRIKNNLQSISSLLNLQSNRMVDSEAKSAVEESKLRVEAMSNLHHKLYNGEDLAVVELSEFIEEIVEGVLQTFGFNELMPAYAIEDVQLAADQTLSIGLIINELVTNSCKYAFRDNENPTLSIKSFFENDEYVIELTDNGKNNKDYSEFNTITKFQKSFGMQLIQTQIIQLQGSYYFYYKNGTQFMMRFKPILCNF